MKILCYGILLLSIVTTGCTSSLKQWTEQELSPYLVKELGEHPRFKHQPVILLDMNGEQVEAEIDQLTANVREQVFNTLLQSKGVNLTWQASVNALQHHTRLQDLQCNAKQKNRFYIGFDLKPVNDQFQLSVKALDPEQGRWVSGFGKTWQGSLSAQDQQLLMQTYPDEVLRGLRALPFTEQQIDLLANYLAKNVSCLLQQSSLDDLYIYAENSTQQPFILKNTLALIVNYLSRFNEVHIVNQPDKANVILNAQVHRIDENLYQIWLIAQDKQANAHLKGIDTVAYATLSQAALQVDSTVVDNPTFNPLLVVPINKPELRRVLPNESAKLFNTLNLIRPIGEPFCRTTNPWVMGEYVIKKGLAISHCFGLKISLNQDSEVFLILENSQGLYYKLLPDYDQLHFKLFAGEDLRYPESNLFKLESFAATETIHAVAVNDPFVANKLHQVLKTMPVCCESTLHTKRVYWNEQLKSLQNKYRGKIDWQVIEVKR